MTFDGKPYDCNFLRYSELTKGAKLRFAMQSEPDTTRGTAPSACGAE